MHSIEPEARSRTGPLAAILWPLLFAGLFFLAELPHTSPPLIRFDVLLALPDLLLDAVSESSDGPPGGWQFFPQRLPLIGSALMILSGAWGLGHIALRALQFRCDDWPERTLAAFGTGLAGVSLLTLACGLLAQRLPLAMSQTVTVVLLVALAGSEAALRIRERSVRPRSESSAEISTARSLIRVGRKMLSGQIPFEVIARGAAVVVMAVFLLAMALGSMLPPVEFDVREYHLGGPKEWFQTGSIHFLPHNIYTSFPFLTEMLLLTGMLLHGDWYMGALAGQLVLMTFAPLTALAACALARRWFGNAAGWLAALIYLTTPWTYLISITAWVEGALTFYLAATLLVVTGGTARPEDGWRQRLILTGLLAGSAFGCKYPGLISVVIPLGSFALWRSMREALADRGRTIRAALAFGLGAGLTAGPWLLKNLMQTGNPVYPLATSLLGGLDRDPQLLANWQRAHAVPNYALSDLFGSLWRITVSSEWLSPLLFALAPLALMCRGQRKVVAGLCGYAAVLFLSWWLLTHRIDRFWIPLLPVVCVLAGSGTLMMTHRRARLVLAALIGAGTLFNLGLITTLHPAERNWLGDLNQLRTAAERTVPGIALLNQSLPPGARVLMVGEAQIFDARFELRYNTVFDSSLFEEWCSARPAAAQETRSLLPVDVIRTRFQQEGITHIFVNWKELLRYRLTYGSPDFLAPASLRQLQQNGLLRRRDDWPAGAIELSALSAHEIQELERWAPETLIEVNGQRWFITSELYEPAESVPSAFSRL